MNRLPLWLTIAFAVIVALLVGLIGGGIVLPQDYRLIKDDRPYKDEDSDLGRYMIQEGFKLPAEMQKIIDDNDFVGLRGVVYRGLDGKEKYFEVEYAERAEAEKMWSGMFVIPEIKCRLVFLYETKKCVAAKWQEKDGKEYQKRFYGGKPA